MKEGRNLQELAAEVFRQRETKHDYVAPANGLRFEPVFYRADGNVSQVITPALAGVELGIPTLGSFQIGSVAHDQFATALAIPRTYYDRMLTQAPELLARNANHWLERQEGRRLVRTLDNRARAILSDGYRPLDNFDLLEAVLPKIAERKLKIVSAEVTDRRLYVKAIAEDVTREITAAGRVQQIHPMVMFTNSEVGLGGLAVEVGYYIQVCANGTHAFNAFRQVHLGKKLGGNGHPEEWVRDDTRTAEDAATFLRARDAVDYALSAEALAPATAKIADAMTAPITGDPVKVVEVAQKKLGLTDDERTGVLLPLIAGGDLSQFGLSQAVTRHSQDVAQYDRATELESVGYRVIELPRSEWREVAEAK